MAIWSQLLPAQVELNPVPDAVVRRRLPESTAYRLATVCGKWHSQKSGLGRKMG